ncbi:hypothetical protein HKD37_14G040322 [Glycine soja]
MKKYCTKTIIIDAILPRKGPVDAILPRKGLVTRAMSKRLQEDWARADKEGLRVLMNLRLSSSFSSQGASSSSFLSKTILGGEAPSSLAYSLVDGASPLLFSFAFRCIYVMQSYSTRALDRRLQEDWARDPREGPRVLMSLRAHLGGEAPSSMAYSLGDGASSHLLSFVFRCISMAHLGGEAPSSLAYSLVDGASPFLISFAFRCISMDLIEAQRSSLHRSSISKLPSLVSRAMSKRLQEDWARATEEGPRVLMNLRGPVTRAMSKRLQEDWARTVEEGPRVLMNLRTHLLLEVASPLSLPSPFRCHSSSKKQRNPLMKKILGL